MNKFSLKLAKCVVFRSFNERIFAPRDPNGKSVGKTPSPDSAHLRGKIFRRMRGAPCASVPPGKKTIPAKFRISGEILAARR